MTLLAESPAAHHDQGAHHGPGDAGPVTATVPSPDHPADRPDAARDRARTIRSWPLLLLAFPAAAEGWSGWVGIAQKTGFGLVHPLPGLWSSLHLATTLTLPIGVEAYAAYALRAWLATEPSISPRGGPSPPRKTSSPPRPPGPAAPPSPAKNLVPGPPRQPDTQAVSIARELAAAGKPVSRRALRDGGVKGSNESLNALAHLLNAELANEQAIVP